MVLTFGFQYFVISTDNGYTHELLNVSLTEAGVFIFISAYMFIYHVLPEYNMLRLININLHKKITLNSPNNSNSVFVHLDHYLKPSSHYMAVHNFRAIVQSIIFNLPIVVYLFILIFNF